MAKQYNVRRTLEDGSVWLYHNFDALGLAVDYKDRLSETIPNSVFKVIVREVSEWEEV